MSSMMKKVLMIDNYDSFTYNLVHYIEEIGPKVTIKRNDTINIKEIIKINPEIIFISPGPCTPKEAGISVELIKNLSGQIPIFGVCLGHQSIGQAFGAKIVKADIIMHGKTSKLFHTGHGLFKGIANPPVATRSHSLIAEKISLPTCRARMVLPRTSPSTRTTFFPGMVGEVTTSIFLVGVGIACSTGLVLMA